MMTIASMQKTTVTELRPVLETQLPIWKFRFRLIKILAEIRKLQTI
jgi:hypothetical protein